MQKFQNIQAWRKSQVVTVEVYAFTRNFSSDERHGLSAQMRRSAAAIPANIAGGSGKQSQKDFARFLKISFCSARELEYQINLSWSLGYLSRAQYDKAMGELSEIQRMLHAFIRTLRRAP